MDFASTMMFPAYNYNATENCIEVLYENEKKFLLELQDHSRY